MKLGTINNCILLGGGNLLLEAAQLARKYFRIFVITSPRHAKESMFSGKLEYGLQKLNIPYIIADSLDTSLFDGHCDINESIGISVGAPWIFKDNIINLFNGKLFNLHGTGLPRDRGGGGFSWRIMRDDRIGYATIHQICAGIDQGNIIKQYSYLFPTSARLPIDYEAFSISQYLDVLNHFFQEIVSNFDFNIITQQEDFSTYWPRLCTDVHGFIDWSWTARDVVRFICAFDRPYTGASTLINGDKVRLRNAQIEEGCFHPFQFGLIYRISGDSYFIAANQGTVITKMFIENSTKIDVGDRLYTPVSLLEQAKQSRVKYNSKGINV